MPCNDLHPSMFRHSDANGGIVSVHPVRYLSHRPGGRGELSIRSSARSFPAMTLEHLRDDLTKSLTAAEPYCDPDDHRRLTQRVTRFSESLPALDTRIGRREAVRQGTSILDEIYRTVADCHSQPTRAQPMSYRND